MTTFEGRELKLLVLAASQADPNEIFHGRASDEMKAVIYKAKSLVGLDEDNMWYCKAFRALGDR